MPPFGETPARSDAVQWHRNGDHPDDGCAHNHQADDEQCEGKVVRYFRRPEPQYDGQLTHETCGRTWHDHGWIDTPEGGHTVCPGDWIVTGPNGYYPCKPCPHCDDHQMIPTRQFAEHLARIHPDATTSRSEGPAYAGPPSAAPPMRGPALTYIGAPHEGTQTSLRVDMRALEDPRERAICRALLHHALALLDASEPPRKVTLGAEAGRS